MCSTKAMFTVLVDKVADADAYDVEDVDVGNVSSGQLRATIPLQGSSSASL